MSDDTWKTLLRSALACLALLKADYPALIREQITVLPAGKPMLDRAWEVVAQWCEGNGGKYF